jgi:glycosyltransferase involved in cell wall biosynthesis
MLAARRAAVPYLLSFHSGGHSSGARNALRGVQWRALRPLLAGARRLIAVSEFEARHFQQQLRVPRERFVVIPNGAHLPRPLVGQTPAQGGALLLSVGRLERYKGHHRIIAALPMIAQVWPDIRLRIVGSGPYERELRRLAARAGVATRVEIGPIPPSDRRGMAGALAEASLVVLLSEYEAHPISVMEALAMRRLVLVADTSGLHEIVERGLAQAVPLGASPGQIAAAVLAQLEHPETPPSVELPTWEQCVGRLAALYAETLSRDVRGDVLGVDLAAIDEAAGERRCAS